MRDGHTARPVCAAALVAVASGCSPEVDIAEVPDSGAPVSFPSCAPTGPGMTDCGATAQDNCCTSIEVTDGTYYRIYTNDGGGPADEDAAATVSGFRLDEYLVTVGRFRQFVNAWSGGWMPRDGSGIHAHLNNGYGLVAAGGDAGLEYETGWATEWDSDADVDPTNQNLTKNCVSPQFTWTSTPSPDGSSERRPINCVTWFEAYAFCIWDGGFLPSEAEWEYAAAGGGGPTGQREYPWGSTAPGTSQYAIYDCNYPGGADASPACTGVENIAPVGTATRGVGLWGQLDLAGDVLEWTLDVQGPYVSPCLNCAYGLANPSTADNRVMRGATFLSPGTAVLMPTNRFNNPPRERTALIGFRCARTA